MTHHSFKRPTAISRIGALAMPSVARNTIVENPAPVESPLQKLHVPKFSKLPITKVKEQDKIRVKLDMVYATLEAPTPTPPCDTCETSVCCSHFYVPITEEEYASGRYDGVAVKVEAEAADQLESTYRLPKNPLRTPGAPAYYLEGVPGEPCPYLKNNRCSIYAHRPLICRTYTCVNDPRITEEMRKQPTNVS